MYPDEGGREWEQGGGARGRLQLMTACSLGSSSSVSAFIICGNLIICRQ